ncbi:hypothetical protein [Microvirga sp. G4-2]|uniref:hypothetical protein n=1 Tax=Microvirga sp. G4-2 TaxID=3434467 RepID=UPI004043B9F8
MNRTRYSISTYRVAPGHENDVETRAGFYALLYSPTGEEHGPIGPFTTKAEAYESASEWARDLSDESARRNSHD